MHTYTLSANVNVTNKGTGWTPCHCAAFQGHGKVLLQLMQHSPDVSIKDSLGRYMLHICSGTLLFETANFVFEGLQGYSSIGVPLSKSKQLTCASLVNKFLIWEETVSVLLTSYIIIHQNKAWLLFSRGDYVGCCICGFLATPTVTPKSCPEVCIPVVTCGCHFVSFLSLLASRTAADFGSALDSIWPFFASLGCKRTSKADLIRLDIVKRVSSSCIAVSYRLELSIVFFLFFEGEQRC